MDVSNPTLPRVDHLAEIPPSSSKTLNLTNGSSHKAESKTTAKRRKGAKSMTHPPCPTRVDNEPPINAAKDSNHFQSVSRPHEDEEEVIANVVLTVSRDSSKMLILVWVL